MTQDQRNTLIARYEAKLVQCQGYVPGTMERYYAMFLAGKVAFAMRKGSYKIVPFAKMFRKILEGHNYNEETFWISHTFSRVYTFTNNESSNGNND